MKPFYAAGQLYNARAIVDLRADIIVLRDAALTNSAMDWAVTLTHAVAILTHIADEIDHGTE